MLQRIELILTPSIAPDNTVRLTPFTRRGSSYSSARGGVAAEGTFDGQKMYQNSRKRLATRIENASESGLSCRVPRETS